MHDYIRTELLTSVRSELRITVGNITVDDLVLCLKLASILRYVCMFVCMQGTFGAYSVDL